MHAPRATAADTPQLALWRSEFGASYTVRNDLERPARVESLRTVLAGLEIAHALEVGCNVGWNLRYLRQVGVPRVWGIEPQRFAVARARARDPELDVFEGTAFDLPFKDRRFDLVFTSGVLIHIGPGQLGVNAADVLGEAGDALRGARQPVVVVMRVADEGARGAVEHTVCGALLDEQKLRRDER